jgi:hypothetical protein
VWLVVNQSTDSYDVYVNSGTDDATEADRINPTPLSFRNGTTDPLNTILALAAPAPIDNAVRIDDLVHLSGVDLTNPTSGLDAGLVWTAQTMTIDGNYSQHAGAVLELDLFDPANHDVLVVTDHADLAGTLDVALAVGAPQPQLGDQFAIFEFGTSAGSFDAFNLPSLEAGLMWKTSDLIGSGILEVAAATSGDFDLDGDVDGSDFLLWQRGESPSPLSSSDLADWQANFGASASTPTSTAVPEPSSWVSLLLALAASGQVTRRRSR